MTEQINIELYHFLFAGLIAFILGILGIICSKNIIKVLISLEFMFCGITLNLAAFAIYCDAAHYMGYTLALLVIVLSILHAVIGYSLAFNMNNPEINN